MSKPRVYLTRELPPKVMELLRAETLLSMNTADRVLSRAELKEAVKGQDALLCLLTDTVDAEVMDANPGLKVISNYAVGYNNIDVKAATERGIVVTNTPGVLTHTTADLAFALLLAVARRVVEADHYLRRGEWQGWGPLQFLGADVSGSTLGIVGLGRIGRAMISRARGFDMQIYYWNRSRLQPAEEDALGIQYAPLQELLAISDFVSLHLALNAHTHHLIDEAALRQMKPTAFLINTARGPVVDEKALVKALSQGWIAGAGLDVFEHEPQVEAELLSMPQVVLLPHLGSATIGTRTQMGLMAVENLLSVWRGQRPANLVNPELWKGA